MAYKLLHKETVIVEGLKEPFVSEVRFCKSYGSFSMTYPKRIVSTNLVEVDTVVDTEYKKVYAKFKNEVELFESLTEKAATVILYQIEERGSYKDGYGEGFVFIWAVFRKTKRKNYRGDRYFYLRGSDATKKDLFVPVHDLKEWKEIRWTERAEGFFQKLSVQINSIYDKLDFFVNHMDAVDIENNINLLENGQTETNP